MSEGRARNLRTLIAGAMISGVGLLLAVLGHFVFEIMPMTIVGVALAVIGFTLELRGIGLLGGAAGAGQSRYVTQQVPESIDPSSPGSTSHHGGESSTVSTRNPTDPDAYKNL